MQEPRRASRVTLYQFALCPFSHKVKAAMEVKGIPYTEVEVNPMTKKELPPMPESAEQILHIHAQVAEKAGLVEDARASSKRAHEEVEAKSHRLTDEELRNTYLVSPLAKKIAAHFEHLHG